MKNARYVVCAFALFFAFAPAPAQSLSFNRVVNYTLTPSSAQVFTVPAGKTWKIESVGLNYAGSCQLYLRTSTGTQIAALVWTNSSAQPFYNAALPLWLEENFAGQFYSVGGSSAGGFVSIIEFNIVP